VTRRDLVLDKHREAIKQAAARCRGRSISLVGSVARGEDDQDSDYDFLVDFDEKASIFDRAALISALKDLLGEEVDVVPLGKRKTPARDAMLDEAVPL